MSQPDITVYGAYWCPDCRRSKQFLGEHRSHKLIGHRAGAGSRAVCHRDERRQAHHPDHRSRRRLAPDRAEQRRSGGEVGAEDEHRPQALPRHRRRRRAGQADGRALPGAKDRHVGHRAGGSWRASGGDREARQPARLSRGWKGWSSPAPPAGRAFQRRAAPGAGCAGL